MNTFSFRDESAGYLGGPKERKKIMREIRRLELEELQKLRNATVSDGPVGYASPFAVLADNERREEREGISTFPGLLRSTPSPFSNHGKEVTQLAHIETISQPRVRPTSTFTNYLRAPAGLRKRGLRSPDVLFQPTLVKPQPVVSQMKSSPPSNVDDSTFLTGIPSMLRANGSLEEGGSADVGSAFLPGLDAGAPHVTSVCSNGIFWVYGRHKVSQSTLGSTSTAASAKSPSLTVEQFKRLPLWQDICKKLASMIRDGSNQEKFGILFDLVSTGKVIAKGTSHLVGRLIYDFVENCRLEQAITKLKFVFVGITDNVNCCAARDVFCLDDSVGGKYVGEYKRTFNALDGVHMFAVMPPAYTTWCDETVKQLTRPAAAIKVEQEAKVQLELQRQKQERNHKRNVSPPMRHH